MPNKKIMDDENNKELDAQNEESIESLATPQDPRQPFGVTLANARKELDKTVEQVARELNLSAQTIRALETGQSEGLPELTYVRGYIRSYSRLLNLDPEVLLEAFTADYRGTKDVSYDDLPHGMSDEDFLMSRRRRSPWLWMVIVAAFIMTMWIWTPSFISDFFASSPEILSSSPQERQSEREARVTENGDVEARLPQLAEEATEQQPTDSAENVVAADSQNTLILSFASTCWVDVRDSQGTRLAFQSVVGGEQLELSSNLTMDVFLGNAEGVTATLNGEDYDLAPFIQGVYAKFSIPATSAE